MWKVQRNLYRDGKLVRALRTTICSWPDLDVDGAGDRAQEVTAQIKKGIESNAAPQAPKVWVVRWTLERAYAAYADDMRKRGARETSVADMLYAATYAWLTGSRGRSPS